MASIRHFKLHKYIGLVHTLLGIIIFLLELIGIIIDESIIYFANGIYAGIFLLATGVVYMVGGSKKSKCFLISALILEITTTLVVAVAISLAAYEMHQRRLCRHQECQYLYNRIKTGSIICVCCLELVICLVHVLHTCLELCSKQTTTVDPQIIHPPPNYSSAFRGSVVIQQSLNLNGSNHYSNKLSAHIQGGPRVETRMQMCPVPEWQGKNFNGWDNFNGKFSTQFQGGPTVETQISSPMQMSTQPEVRVASSNKFLTQIQSGSTLVDQIHASKQNFSQPESQRCNMNEEFPPNPAIYHPPQSQGLPRVQISQEVESPYQ